MIIVFVFLRTAWPPIQELQENTNGHDVAYTTNGLPAPTEKEEEPSLKVVMMLFWLQERLLQTATSLKMPSPGWVKAWHATLQGMSSVVSHKPVAKDDTDALLALQRAALAPELVNLPHSRILELFTNILLPLLATLLATQQDNTTSFSATLKQLASLFTGPTPEAQAPPSETSIAKKEIQSRAVGLLTKCFLHYQRPLSKASNEFPLLWQRILNAFSQCYNQNSLPGGPGLLQEAVEANLNNMVLVMATATVTEMQDTPEDDRVFQ